MNVTRSIAYGIVGRCKTEASQQRLHLQPPKMENGATSPLPQYYADMLDWRQKADLLAAAWYSLPPTERAQAVIYTENYGDASALSVYRPDVPEAIEHRPGIFCLFACVR